MIRGVFAPSRGPLSALLTLPEPLTRGLGLLSKSGADLILADGTTRYFDFYSAEVCWDGTWIPVLASALGDNVLIGMRMFAGHRLIIDAVAGGEVSIGPVP